ncbi:MAG: Gfo/Idh/MocA family oxidoreductase [Acidobacteria bacterium]|nr:Gfo/Idh/MocA family oxidoreductase [Acidobacteriota bacterium]
MERARIGIVGLGIMGDPYTKIYLAHPLANVVAATDRKQTRA